MKKINEKKVHLVRTELVLEDGMSKGRIYDSFVRSSELTMQASRHR